MRYKLIYCTLLFFYVFGVLSCGMDAEDDLLSQKDRAFVTEAAYANIALSRGGSMAAQQALNVPVKEYGTLMHACMSAAQADLNAISVRAAMQAPQETTEAWLEKLAALAVLQNSAFDSAYMQLNLNLLDSAIMQHTAQVSDGRNPRLRQYAADKLIVLRQQRMTGDSLLHALFP